MDVTKLHLRAGFDAEPFLLRPVAALGEGQCYALGPGGDKNPGFVLGDIAVRNTGTRDLLVGKGLVGAVAGDERILVPAGTSRVLEGEYASMVLHNAQGSGGATSWDLDARKLQIRNHTKQGGHPGHGELFARIAGTPNGFVQVVLEAFARMRVVGHRSWSKTVPTSTGTFVATLTGAGNNLLDAASINLKGLTTVDLETQALTGTAAHLDLEPGAPIVWTATSNNVDLVAGDVLLSLLYELL